MNTTQHWNAATAVRFNALFASIEKTIEFNPKWHNGTGYFDGVVSDKELQAKLSAGELVKCESDDGRKLIIIGTPVVPVVVFQRSSSEPDYRHCMNGPTMFKRVGIVNGTGDTINEGLMDQLFGMSNDYNVGKRLQALAALLAGEIHYSGRKMANVLADEFES